MSLTRTFTNLAKGGASALSSVASYVDEQLEKKHNAEFQDKLSAKPRKEYGGQIMTDNELEMQKKEIEKWKKIANEVDGDTTKQPEYSKGKKTEPNVKKNKYNDEKYIKRRAQHDKKKQRKKNNLHKLQNMENYPKAKELAHAKFDEYVEKLNLTDTIKKAKEAGLAVGQSFLYYGNWVYWGLVKNIPLGEGGGGPWRTEPHGIGVAVDPKYLNVIDDKLLMFNQEELVNKDQLDTSNLGGFVIHGDNIPQCDKTKYDNNIKCIDTNSSQVNIIKTINNTLIEANDDQKIGAYIIGINMHGSKSGYLSDREDLVSKTINAFDTQQKEGFKINKPCLILKNSCFDARTEWNKSGSENKPDDYDELCKKVSNCTNEYTVGAYHNSKDETNWGADGLKNVFANSYDYAFDLYKDGNLIQKNITAEEMNKYMNNTLNNGTWDIPDSREKYIHFMEQLVPAIKNQTIDTEPSPSTFIEQTEQPKEQEPSTEQQQTNNYNGLYGGLGLLGATAATIGGVIGCCYKKEKGCFKPKLNSQNQNNNTARRPKSADIGINNNINMHNLQQSERINIFRLRENNHANNINLNVENGNHRSRNINNNVIQEVNVYNKNNLTQPF